jgi:hypothetical protein
VARRPPLVDDPEVEREELLLGATAYVMRR